MSVPETEPAQPTEGAAAAPGKAEPWSDPRLPWLGKPRTADILCWAGIVLSGVFFWALLPLRVSLIGTHPVVAELLNGSTESIISAAAFASVGQGTLAVVLLAAIPGLMKFDILYWWAGRLWGERFIVAAISVLLWAGMLAGLGYTLGHHAVVAAKTVSHYSLWFTIGIVVLSVLLALRSQRRPMAAPDGQPGGQSS